MQRAILLAVLSLAFGATTLRADDGEPARFAIATLDILKVFKGSTAFTRQMDALKKKIETAENDARRQQSELTAEKAKLDESRGKVSDAEFNAAAKSLAERASKLQIELNVMKRELLTEEAEYYRTTYDAVRAEVRKICEARRIRLVVRADNSHTDEDTREEILARVNRAVIFADELDLTEDVIKALNAATEAAEEKQSVP